MRKRLSFALCETNKIGKIVDISCKRDLHSMNDKEKKKKVLENAFEQ